MTTRLVTNRSPPPSNAQRCLARLLVSGPGGRWTIKHRHWLSQQHFDDQASRITYADYLHAHDVLLARRDNVGRELEPLAPNCVWAETIARLCCLRGINTLTALGLCVEIGDWRRFDHPNAIAKYVGSVPSEHSSGQTRWLGKITKAGSSHAAGCSSKPPCITGSRRRSVASSPSASAATTLP